MSGNLHLVFSTPGEGVSDDEFDRWYEEHLDEILSMPGFHSAQRYRLQPAVVDGAVSFPFGHLVVYQVDDDTRRLMADMEAAQLVTADSYEDRKADGDDGGPQLPQWWSQVRFHSFNAIAVGERHDAV
jgi:hypothetical protein